MKYTNSAIGNKEESKAKNERMCSVYELFKIASTNFNRKPEALIESMNDHKGFLTVTWDVFPNLEQRQTIADLWAAHSELRENVEHITLEYAIDHLLQNLYNLGERTVNKNDEIDEKIKFYFLSSLINLKTFISEIKVHSTLDNKTMMKMDEALSYVDSCVDFFNKGEDPLF
jgi:hypothetical protein